MKNARHWMFGTAMLLLCNVCGTEALGESATRQSFSIQAQRLDTALTAFAQATGLQLLFPSNVAMDQTAPPVSGSLTPEAALQLLLKDSGLSYQYVNPRTVAIRPAQGPARAGTIAHAADASGALQVAQAAASQGAGQGEDQTRSSSASASSEPERSKVEEIIVTAQKREQRLQDVPGSVSVITAQTLMENNDLNIEDYYHKLPGLNFFRQNQSRVLLSIRGIRAETLGTATVGILIDDVPLLSDVIVPSVDPGDLARVELLRGPQGTLYGASNMGGLLKFVTTDPVLTDFSASVGAGVSAVSGGDTGHNFRAAANIPVSETFAVRVAGFVRRDPGYIDDPALGRENLNFEQGEGGRISALWRPSDVFSLKAQALTQTMESDGSDQVHVLPGLQNWQQSNLLPGAGEYKRRIELYSISANANLWGADLASITAYQKYNAYDLLDSSYSFGTTAFTVFGVRGARNTTDQWGEYFTQELRVAIPLTANINWMIGGYYSDRLDGGFVQSVRAVVPQTGEDRGNIASLVDNVGNDVNEYAPFTNLTVTFLDRIELQAGVRQTWFKDKGNDLAYTGGAVFNPNRDPEERLLGALNPHDEDTRDYLLTGKFNMSPDLALYAKFATGYRTGNDIDSGPASSCRVMNFQCIIQPDKTKNYEIGFKGFAFGRTLYYELAGFHIDWSNLQTTENNGLLNYTTNAGKARSRGVELTATYQSSAGLSLSLTGAYTDAELTENFPASGRTAGFKGDRLPFSAPFSGSFSVDQEMNLTPTLRGSFGATFGHIGARKGIFRPITTPTRQDYPAYERLDLHASLTYNGDWKLQSYVNNVTDERGMLAGGIGQAPAFGFIYIMPRNYGMSLTKSF